MSNPIKLTQNELEFVASHFEESSNHCGGRRVLTPDALSGVLHDLNMRRGERAAEILAVLREENPRSADALRPAWTFRDTGPSASKMKDRALDQAIRACDGLLPADIVATAREFEKYLGGTE